MATTTNYGWETPDDTDLVKDGALAMRTTANAVDSTLGTALNNKLHAGLVLIKTQAVGTGVASVTLTDAFSSAYDDYRIVINSIDFSVTTNIRIQFGSATTAYYGSQLYDSFSGGSTGTDRVNNGSSIIIGVTGTASDTFTSFDVFAPNVSQYTGVNGTYHGGGYSGWFGGSQASTTQFTAFSILAGTGTMTGGTIAVYGYGKI